MLRCARHDNKMLRVTGALKGDRKSTRLNSSHSQISYAVFCLKKKTIYSDGIRAAGMLVLPHLQQFLIVHLIEYLARSLHALLSHGSTSFSTGPTRRDHETLIA